MSRTQVRLISKKGSTLHDYPYTTASRKCPHFWIINVTPPGLAHCTHHCLYCYARQAIYSNYSEETLVYNNLPELVGSDLKRIGLCPLVSMSNVSDPCQPIPELRAEVRHLVQLLGMTYATCQELGAEESDSQGLPHCERFLLPFARKQSDGRFKAIERCTANCHVSCRDLVSPPYGQPRLVLTRPFKVTYLRGHTHGLQRVM